MNHLMMYIDPGSGSYLVQMIIAGVLAGLFYFKNLWIRVKSFFGSIFSKGQKNGSADEIAENDD